MRRLTAVAVAAAAVSWLATSPAAAATPYHIATIADTYVPASWTIAPGDTLTLVNLENSPHDVVSEDGLFRSATLYGAGTTAPVVGVSSLEPGGYAFYCSVHPYMRGSITVS
jgi:plastocyanin